MKCKSGKCTEDTCNRDKDCSDKYVCHPKQKTCLRSWIPECHDSNDCAVGTGYCVNYFCTSSPPIIRCESNDDCPSSLPTCSVISKTCNKHFPYTREMPWFVCLSTSQCPDGHVCLNQWCRKDVKYPVCMDDQDCRGNEKCIKSVCEEENPECMFDNECKENEVCFTGKCYKEVPIGCHSGIHCPKDKPDCINQYCRSEPIQICETVIDCGKGFGTVDCINKRCFPLGPKAVDKPKTVCSNNGNCPKDQWCTNGICTVYKPEKACDSEKDCNGEEICWHQVCQIVHFPPKGCTSNEDCPKKTPICSGNVCYKKRGPWCDTNQDCFSHKPICYQNTCHDDVVPKCKRDIDCPLEKNKCERGECTRSLKITQCSQHEECPIEQPYCLKGECIPDVYEWCNDDKDCLRADSKVFRCVNKWCKPDDEKVTPAKWDTIIPQPKDKCQSDSNCKSKGSRCIRYERK